MKSTPLTHADEHKVIDFEVYKFKQKMFKLSKTFKYVRVSDIDITYSEPIMTDIVPWYKFWKR